MSDHSKIHWTEATWNPVVGCERVSPGCANCYAVRDARRMAGNPNPLIATTYTGLVERQGNGQLDWTGTVKCLPERLDVPLSWRRPRRIFVCSQSDLFHEAVPDEFIDRVFMVMACAPGHTFQLLTKRAERMRAYCSSPATTGRLFNLVAEVTEGIEGVTRTFHHVADGQEGFQLPNAWLGVSVEDQPRADERIPWLLQTPSAVRFLSCEPLLEPIDIRRYLPNGVDWVICGGESGPQARDCAVEWVRGIVGQCRTAGVAVYVKQLGRHSRSGGSDTDGVYLNLRDRKGGDPSEWPEDLRVREYPMLAETVPA